jgi:uncharacterized membrane protein
MQLAHAAAAVMLLSSAALAQPAPPNLLATRAPVETSGVRRAGVLSDHQLAFEGDGWKTRLTAAFADTAAFVSYDLGGIYHLRAALLQADHNDSYALEVSSDGRTFTTAWRAPAVHERGLRTRVTTELHAEARYVRLRPRSGDGHFSVSQLELFEQLPAALPAEGVRYTARSLDARLRDKTLLLGLSLLAPLLLLRRGSRLRWVVPVIGLPLIAGYQFARAVYDAVPVEAHEVSLVRGVIAAVGAAAIARAAFSRGRLAAHLPSVLLVLCVCAGLACMAFYNLGQPQFYSAGRGRWTFAHHLDLRQYYPTAKYFRELGYLRMYEADVAAYLEDSPGVSLESLGSTAMRDLSSSELVSIADRKNEIATIRRRFTPERWQAYKRDAAWFRAAMGGMYLDSLIDFGANATPVWMATAHALFTLVSPSDAAFTVTGLLDLLLFAALFLAIQRSFGLWTMLVAMLVFGANDFVMYGTNWAGATLRHDWLAYIGLGACALKRDRTWLGGALLGLATMIRAFPALCFIGIALPAIWRGAEGLVRTRRLPSWRQLVMAERATLQIAAGGVLAMLAAFALSAWLLPAAGWIEWFSKVAQIEAAPHPACVALRNLVAGWEDQERVLRGRQLVYWSMGALYVGLVACAARGKRPEQAAVLGLILVPVVLYPANYYLHVVCLLPLLANEQQTAPGVSERDARLWIVLLLMCSAQYFTVLVSELALHFYLASVILFAALFALLVMLVAEVVRAIDEADSLPPLV